MKITKNKFIASFCLMFVLILGVFVFIPDMALADSLLEGQIAIDKIGTESFKTDPGDVQDIRLVIAKAIKVFLGFMGIIFLLLMIYSGVTWMTAAGQDDKVNKAKSLIVTSVIGLIIIVSSFAIATLITSKIFEAAKGAGVAAGCGNGTCDIGEDNSTCPGDCP